MIYYLIYRDDRILQIYQTKEIAISDLESYQRQDDKPSMIPPSNYYLKIFISR